ncbi:MAG TPA: efflux RND transporter permease subunit [Microbacteriaceae bacterium]|nr:efflux RND transporter permease subunit [Microbacteriaceae bacterium]
MKTQKPLSPKLSRTAKLLRTFVPALIILIWFIGAGIGGPYFGKIGEVSSNDPSAYLPSSAEATLVQELLSEFRDSDEIPAVVVTVGSSKLTDYELGQIDQAVASLTKSVDGIGDSISPVIPSEDGKATQVFIPIDSSGQIDETVTEISSILNSSLPDSLTSYVTGPAGFTADLTKAFAGIDGLLLVVALLAVFIILIFVYRSLLLPIAVLSTSLFALTVALLTNWWLAKLGIIMLSGQTQGILFILVIGAATDYSLLYVSRFREQLRVTNDKWLATRDSLRGSFEPILASGGTVIAGLLCLLLSDLKSNSALGPVASIGIVFAMLSALTLLPAILFAFGRAAFWPRRPIYDPVAEESETSAKQVGVWARLATMIRTKHRPIWIITTIVLIVGAAGATQLNADGVAQSELVLGSSEARTGQEVLGEHFPDGSGSPAFVVAPESEIDQVSSILIANTGVEGVAIVSSESPSGTAQVTADGISALGPPGTPAPTPTVVAGSVLLQATLANAPDSKEAEKTVRDLRGELHEQIPNAFVGGVTATAIDTNDSSIRDRTLIIPVVLIVILLILMLLLRSIVTPILLVLTTVVSFGTALGVAALVFNNVFKFAGADPAVPLYGFVFLVALGIDYNIFLMTRVREESLKHGTREGILRGLTVTGGVITSAGLVLAATFAALAVIPILFLVQIAFIVAFGVLLDTFIVRSFLVPAISYDIGRKIWWPSKLSRMQA